VFLLLAAPSPGTAAPRPGEVLLIGGGVLVIVSGCVAVARWGRGTQRALSLAAATGALFGVTAGLAKVAANDLHRGVGEVLRDWPGYAALGCAAAGFVLSQHAFRAGVAVAPALAVMVVSNPLAGIGSGSCGWASTFPPVSVGQWPWRGRWPASPCSPSGRPRQRGRRKRRDASARGAFDQAGQPVEGLSQLPVDVVGRFAAVVARVVAEEGQVQHRVAGAAFGRGNLQPAAVVRAALPAPFEPSLVAAFAQQARLLPVPDTSTSTPGGSAGCTDTVPGSQRSSVARSAAVVNTASALAEIRRSHSNSARLGGYPAEPGITRPAVEDAWACAMTPRCGPPVTPFRVSAARAALAPGSA
jgi:hypothetical protein